ncbi:VTT domain-containing protein [Candidatus Kaiserbacteria bacterium]|nr:VTT domain-containing protein [Candidatus Kaiserbacteria bacterium]
MLEFLRVLLDPVAMVQAGGYLGVALIVFAESGVLVGMFLPGDSLLFAAGLLAAGGYLSVGPLALVVVVAAILGDSVGYWFGAKVGPALFRRQDSRFFKQAHVERAQQFFLNYGGYAIVLARFIPIVRTLTPILAGVGTMPYLRFLAFNVIGGIIWGAGIVYLGYFLGSAIPGLERYFLPLTLLIILASVAPILIKTVRASSK